MDMKKEDLKVGIWGLGNEGFALYSYLSSKILLNNITPFTSNEQTLRIKTIHSTGKIEGTYQFIPTNEIRKILECDLIFITTLTTAYEEVASKIASFSIQNNIDLKQKIFVLFSGKLGGVLVFDKVFKSFGIETNVIETDALFACRKIDVDTVWIRGIKKWNLLISNKDAFKSASDLHLYKVIKMIFDDIQLDVADNFIQRGLTDFGAMAHATICLINLANIDSKRDLLFFIDGITENTVRLIEKVYLEFEEVANRFNTHIVDPIILLDRYYGTSKDNLLVAIKNVPNYKHTKMPNSVNNRMLYEDVLNTLYPLTLISKKIGIDLKVIPSIVNIMSEILLLDLEKEGRTLEKMGINNFFKGGKV